MDKPPESIPSLHEIPSVDIVLSVNTSDKFIGASGTDTIIAPSPSGENDELP